MLCVAALTEAVVKGLPVGCIASIWHLALVPQIVAELTSKQSLNNHAADLRMQCCHNMVSQTRDTMFMQQHMHSVTARGVA